MKLREAIEFIITTKGKFFSVRFTKRSTGEERIMNCRTGVHKGLKGGERNYDPYKKGLVPVWDRSKKDFRVIPIEGINAIKIDGEWEEVTS